MKIELAPKHFLKIGTNYILWFDFSNQYVVISESLKPLLDIFFSSESAYDFDLELKASLNISRRNSEEYYTEINEFLVSARSSSKKNIFNNPDIQDYKSPLIPEYGLEEIYAFGNTTFKIKFGSEQIKALIHPQWSHATVRQTKSLSCSFDMFKDGAFLHLFKNRLYVGQYALGDYHLLQGQFALQLINTLYHKHESNWIATFHASTVCNVKEAIMIIGDSGNGKSTLSAVLMANGYDVLADDFTPLLAADSEVYRFPSGISVKEGAFHILEDLYSDFEKFPMYTSNSKGVNVKYIPPIKSFGQALSHFKCTKIVYVKYDPKVKTVLKEVGTEKILETLIPESWLSPLASNAELFLEWLKELSCYELNYSDNATAVSKFSELFDS